ncbi:MAG: GNAT family N-acetyltransferase [Promethearchaeota archaeon]
MEIYEIEQNAFENDGYSIYFLTQGLEFLSNSIFVAEENKLIGYILGALDQKDSNVGWFLNIAVMKGNQGKGIGYKLLEKLMDFFKESRCKEVHLTVTPNNLGAIHLYEKFKFKKIKIIKDYFGKGKDRLLMIREFKD